MRKRVRKSVMCVMALLMLAAAVTAGVGAHQEAQAAEAAAGKAQLSKKKMTLAVGKKATIAFASKPAGAVYTWQSSDKKVASVTKKGVVKAKKAGKAVITCTVKPKTGKKYALKTKVTVRESELSKTDISLKVGEKEKMTFSVKPKKSKVTWKSSNQKVAVVSKNGEVTAKSAGTAVIKCRIKPKSGKRYTLKAAVTVTEAKKTGDDRQNGQKQDTDSQKQTEQNADDKNGNGTDSGSQTEQPETDQAVTEALFINEKTSLLHFGFAQYVAVTYAPGYSMYNTRMIVDGVDVSEAVTPVSDDGSVAKWEITALDPAVLTIVSAEDAALKQSARLTDNAAPAAPAVRLNTSADYVLGYGSLAYWDYYLTNYDDQGKVRVHASKTTFARGAVAKKEEHPFYSPDTEISGGSGLTVIMFNYNTEAEKAWFDQIPESGALELVSYDQYKNVTNDYLVYAKTTVPHGSGMVGQFEIPVNQDNFRNNGRYYVRIKPAGGASVLAAIQLVNAQAPALSLSESRAIQPGQNIHFKVENMVYGITEPIERVTLKRPDGTVEELRFIDDYYLFGDLFVLYNDVERDNGNGVNHTAEAGNYTMTVQATGFKDAEITFAVVKSNHAVPAAAVSQLEMIEVEGAAIDTMSSASFSGSTSGDGSSAGGNVSANLIFSVDLYVNAEIFDKLGLENAYAAAIVDRYETALTGVTAVYTKDGEFFYDFSDYYNAVQNAQIAGRYLSFADYIAAGNAKTVNKPSRVKEVLEDNLLGELIEDNSYYGLEAPALKLVDAEGQPVEAVRENETAYYAADDAAYMGRVDGLYTEQQWYAPLADGWHIEDGKLVIESSLLSLTGDNTFTVRSRGYKDVVITVPYEKVREEITLQLAGEKAVTGQDAQIRLQGSEGDFGANLISVTLDDGIREKNVLTSQAGGTSNNDWYELDETKTTLTLKGGLFKREAVYTLTLQAQYYEPLTLQLDVKQAEDAEDAQQAPKAVSITDRGTSYVISFDDDDAAAAYLNAMTDYSVRVGTEDYRKALLSIGCNTFMATVKDPAYGGRNTCLAVSKSGFAEDAATEVVLHVTGYQTQSFVVNADGTLQGSGEPETESESETETEPQSETESESETETEPQSESESEKETETETETESEPAAEKKAAPTAVPTISYVSSGSYLQIGSSDSTFTEWLAALNKDTTKVTVNGEAFNYESYTWYAGSYGIQNGWVNGSTSVVLTKKGMSTGVNKVVIEADGYAALTWYVTLTEGYYGNMSVSISLTNPEGEDVDSASEPKYAEGEIGLPLDETEAVEVYDMLIEEGVPEETSADASVEETVTEENILEDILDDVIEEEIIE